MSPVNILMPESGLYLFAGSSRQKRFAMLYRYALHAIVSYKEREQWAKIYLADLVTMIARQMTHEEIVAAWQVIKEDKDFDSYVRAIALAPSRSLSDAMAARFGVRPWMQRIKASEQTWSTYEYRDAFIKLTVMQLPYDIKTLADLSLTLEEDYEGELLERLLSDGMLRVASYTRGSFN